MSETTLNSATSQARPLASFPSFLSFSSLLQSFPKHHAAPFFPRKTAQHSSTNGAQYDSPGQRPGFAVEFHPALKGRHNRCFALSGLDLFLANEPRALPWAELFRPFGAVEGGMGAWRVRR